MALYGYRPSSLRETQYIKYAISLICITLLLIIFTSLKNVRSSHDADNYLTRHLLNEDLNIRCVDLHHVNESEECHFVKNTDDCGSDEGFIPYIQFPFCSLPTVKPLAYIILVLWLIFLFIFVGITADDYFCPALTVISDSLKLSPNIAGVTFLAYGNGAPDIFSAVAGFVNSKSTGSLALSALIGAGMFVTTVVVGAISLSVSYDLNQRPYLRDIVFYLGALAWTIIIVHKERINLLQAIGFIVLYVLYVIVVIAGRIIYQKYKKRQRQVSSVQTIETDDDETDEFLQSIPVVCANNDDQAASDEMTPLLIHFRTNATTNVKSVLGELFKCSSADFVDSGIFTKIYTIIKIPIHFFLGLTVTVVELSQQNQNWNKWLQVLQCFFTPLFCVFAAKGGFVMLGGKFPLTVVVAIVSLILAVIVAMTSNTYEPPLYHKLFAFMSFVSSVIWIYSLANEIVNLLRMFGIVFKLSNEILGVTLLAWGNSIADFIANFAVARQGLPQMAIAACFGGPLLNLLLGVGLSCTIATSRESKELILETSRQDYISIGFLATSLISSSIIVPLLGFRLPKWYGIYLLILYAVFLILSILNEANAF